MDQNAHVYVAGHRGMVGSAITRCLIEDGFSAVLTRTHSEPPLDDAASVDKFFVSERPSTWCWPQLKSVVSRRIRHTAPTSFGKISRSRPTSSMRPTVMARAKLLFLGSSCIYPRHAEQPIAEEALLTGPLEDTNLPYAIAKIAGKTMCDAYAKQQGFNAFTVMPCNVYGVGDNFHPEHSHVVAGMMRRFHEAKLSGADRVVVCGTGSPLSELIDADDLADACVSLLRHYDGGGMINAGFGQEISIRDLALLMKPVVKFDGDMHFDTSRRDGTPRKLMDNTKLSALGWRPSLTIQAGIKKMYGWFVDSEAAPVA